MRPRLLALIRREIANQRAGLPARIVVKMNQLEDPEMIEALCEASSSGVPIEIHRFVSRLQFQSKLSPESGEDIRPVLGMRRRWIGSAPGR